MWAVVSQVTAPWVGASDGLSEYIKKIMKATFTSFHYLFPAVPRHSLNMMDSRAESEQILEGRGIHKTAILTRTSQGQWKETNLWVFGVKEKLIINGKMKYLLREMKWAMYKIIKKSLTNRNPVINVSYEGRTVKDATTAHAVFQWGRLRTCAVWRWALEKPRNGKCTRRISRFAKVS